MEFEYKTREETHHVPLDTWTAPHCNSIEMMSTENTSLLPLFNPQLIYFYHSKSINFLFRIVIVEIEVIQMIVRYNPNRIKYLSYF